MAPRKVAIKNNVLKRGKMPCIKRLEGKKGITLHELQEWLGDYFKRMDVPVRCSYLAACEDYRYTDHGSVGAWLLTLQYVDGSPISSSDVAVKSIIRTLKGEAKPGRQCQHKYAFVRILCQHQRPCVSLDKELCKMSL